MQVAGHVNDEIGLNQKHHECGQPGAGKTTLKQASVKYTLQREK